MKRLLFIVLVIVLVGCSIEKISMVDIYMEEEANTSLNNSIQTHLYFNLVNKASHDASCEINLGLYNYNLSNTTTYLVGVVPKQSISPVRLDFEMPPGITDFNLTHNCKFS